MEAHNANHRHIVWTTRQTVWTTIQEEEGVSGTKLPPRDKNPIQPGMTGREWGIRNGEQGMSLCPSRHKPGNTLMKILVTTTPFELYRSQCLQPKQNAKYVHIFNYKLKWIQFSSHSHQWLMTNGCIYISYCSLSPHLYKLWNT